MNSLGHNELIIYQGSGSTHLPLVPHIGVSESGQHWFRWWLVAYSVSRHYLKHCWIIGNWTHRINFSGFFFYQNSDVFIKKRGWKCRLRNGVDFVQEKMSESSFEYNLALFGSYIRSKRTQGLVWFANGTPIQCPVYHMNIDGLVGIKVFITVQTRIIFITCNA